MHEYYNSDDGNQTLTYEVYSDSFDICGAEGILLGISDMHERNNCIVTMILTYELSFNQVPQWQLRHTYTS